MTAAPEEIQRDLEATRSEISRTLQALQDRMSLGSVIDQAIGTMRSGGADFAGNVGRTARDNPVPLALLGVGLTWLMMSERASRRGYAGTGPSSYARHGGAYASGGEHAGAQAGSSRPIEATAAYGSGGAGSGAGASASARGREAAGRVGEAAGRAKAKAAEWSGAASERVSGVGERAGEARAAAADLARGARERTAAYAQGARAAGSRAGEAVGTFVMDHPFVVGTLGLAVGAAIAAALPTSRREERALGEAGDEIKRSAGEQLRQTAGKAKDVAEAASGAAEKEAEERRLTPDAIQQETGRVAQQGAEVVKAATRAAKDEARKPGSQGGGARADEGAERPSQSAPGEAPGTTGQPRQKPQ